MAFDSILKHCSIVFQALICLLLAKATTPYEEIILNDSHLCRLDFEMSQVKLGSDENSAVLVKDGKYFTSRSGRYDFVCRFIVKTRDKNDGIYAVIQELNFRKNEDNKCKDYIEMSVPRNDLTKILLPPYKHVKRFCGDMYPGMWRNTFDSDELEDSDGRDIAPNAYVAPGGEVAVEINIARDRLALHQRLAINIAFTAYKRDCSSKRNLPQCRPRECIYETFINDGVQNCPYTSCADEKSCGSSSAPTEDVTVWTNEMMGSSLGTKVTFGAIACIIMMIITFAFCLCCFKRFKLCAPPPRNLNPRQSSSAALQEVPCILEPSAPLPPEEIETKDLPPSYESLFPVPTQQEQTTTS